MMYLLGLVLVTVASVLARTFNNPILGEKDYQFHTPAAIKVNGTYYLVTWSYETMGKFPIHTSTDLINWDLAGSVFNANNTPIWVGFYSYEPEIHLIGSNFVVYFDTHNSSRGLYAVGAAIASHPLGPYTALDQPIQPWLNESQDYPTIINDQDKLYLLWSTGNSIHAHQLTSNGLSYFSDQTTTLLEPSLTWEGQYMASPWYIHRGNYHYLLYTGGNITASLLKISIGVARSSNALGPYDKLPNPILVPNNDYEFIGFPSVVKDLDDKGDIIFFNAYRKDDPDEVHYVLLASVGWNADDWPYVEDF